MYEVQVTTQFKRDIKRCKRQHKPMDKFKNINELLISGQALPQKNKDHYCLVGGQDIENAILNRIGS